MGSLFPCLGDEIGWECLVRVELNSHHNLRCVCKSWNAALKSPHFYQERKRLRISEQRICILHDTPGPRDRVSLYDLAEKSCKTLAIPAEIYAIEHCHFVKQKLVFITHMSLHCGRNCVWLYDFACSKWRQGAKAPKLRTEFATAADEEGGLIYMAGGHSRLREPIRSASVYNVEEDKWVVLPDMNTNMNNFRGVFADGKFYIMDNRYCRTIEVFDPYTRSWKTMENRFSNSHYFLSAFGRLHCFSDKGLIEYDYSQDKLNIVGTFPTEDWHLNIVFTVVFGDNIFVCRWDTVQGRSFYLLAPPSERGGVFKCIGIDGPLGFQGYSIHAATLDL